MDDPNDRVRIFLTCNPLDTGMIPEVMAEICGDTACYGEGIGRWCIGPEGEAWHRTRWAAQSYSCQVRDARLRELRDEVDRLERMDFGRVR